MALLIGVPREVFPGEKRVATVPEVVEKLIKLGFRVAIESGAGDQANFPDDAYRADKQSAALLGLFPDVPPDKVYSVGNAAGDGAPMALLDVDKRKEADIYARRVDYIELTLVPEFEKTFVQAMWIPNMKDNFPNLAHLLPEAK